MKRIGVGTVNITENVLKYIQDVLDTRRLSYGRYLKRLEAEFSEIHDIKFGIVSNSGTSALDIALQMLKKIRVQQKPSMFTRIENVTVSLFEAGYSTGVSPVVYRVFLYPVECPEETGRPTRAKRAYYWCERTK